MTEYQVCVEDAALGETVEIPDSARDVEIEYYQDVTEVAGVGASDEIEHRVRVKYLDRMGESVP